MASQSANYSVQLLADIAPSGWSAEAWASVADAMIGKTQAHILTDLIENLGIKLKVSEDSIRKEINEGRSSKGLEPLPPPSTKPVGFLERLREETRQEEKDKYSTYIPPGWTEEKLEDHTDDDIKTLSEEDQVKLKERLASDLEKDAANPNQGVLSELPEELVEVISSKLHKAAQQALGLDADVRAYKRKLAPLAQVLMLQQTEEFGFLVIRTSYKDETAWKSFLENLNSIVEAQLGNDYYGSGVEEIQDKFRFQFEESAALAEATIEQCRLRYALLKATDDIPTGLDIGVFLVADEGSVDALKEFGENPAYFLVVDTTYDAKNTYPAGYEGFFKVHAYALWHSLYVALGSGMMTPVEVWQLLQRKKQPNPPAGTNHDEL